jgi:hypothetical protein
MRYIKEELKLERTKIEGLIIDQNKQLMQNGLKSILDLNDKLKSNKDSSRPTLR